MAFFHTSVLDQAVLNEQLKTLFAPATASGSIATFSDGGDDIPVSEYECEIVAQQASGTPTPVSPLPINGFSQSDITVCGKNLAFGYIDSCNIDASGTLVWNTAYRMYIAKVEQGKTYSINLGSLVCGYFDKIPVLNDTSFDRIRVITTSTFTAAHTGFIAFRASPTDNQVSLKVGTDTTYTAYKGNTYLVDFGQIIYGGRLIYENGQWAIEKTYEGVDLGSLSWTYHAPSGDVGAFFDTILPSDSITGNRDVAFDGMSEIYNIIPSRNIGLSGSNIDVCALAHGTRRFITCDARFSNATSYTNAMNGIMLVYPLATPVIIHPTSSAKIKTLSGVNNIFSNTGDNSVKYFTENADSLAELIKAFVV